MKERLAELEMLLGTRASIPAAVTPEPKSTDQISLNKLSGIKPTKPSTPLKPRIDAEDPSPAPRKVSLLPAPACTQVKAPTARVQQIDAGTTVVALQDIIRRLTKENDHLKGRLHNSSCPRVDSSCSSSKEQCFLAPPPHCPLQPPPATASPLVSSNHVPGDGHKTVVNPPQLSENTQPPADIAENLCSTNDKDKPPAASNDTSNSGSEKTPSTGVGHVVTTSTHRNERMQLGRLIVSGKITVDTHPQVLELWNGSLKDSCSHPLCFVYVFPFFDTVAS